MQTYFITSCRRDQQQMYQKNQALLQVLYQELLQKQPIESVIGSNYLRTYTQKVTVFGLPEIPKYYSNQVDLINNKLSNFLRDHDPDTMYQTFFIPKKSGGFREISAPDDALKEIQRQLAFDIVRTTGQSKPIVHAHDTAYAYVEGRSTKDALVIHQKNRSRWFFKIDLKDFFPSWTIENLIPNLKRIYPLTFLLNADLVEKLFQVVSLHGSLPQGAPTSPILTNLAMIPIDKAISDLVWEYDKQHIVYTRYADDLLFSCRYQFNWWKLLRDIKKILEPHKLIVNEDKIRYGSSAGSNWNLGLMLNKDNKITIGHRQKDRMRAALFSFLKDTANGKLWTVKDAQVLAGLVSYMQSIEPNYTIELIKRYEEKTGVNYKQTLALLLS